MMLSILTKRLCPLMSLALAFGCGKKINDPKSSDGERVTPGQTTELSSTLSLQINETVSAITSYDLAKNAWFNLPSTLKVIEGTAIGKRVKIYYNLVKANDYEFHCFYKSTNTAKTLAFEKCESKEGAEIISRVSDLENSDFPMDKNTKIQMQLLNGTGSGLIIESTYQVDWK